MARETLEAEIKTRVPATLKEHFQRIADDRHLDMADIARQAFREYLAKPDNQVQPEPKPEEQPA